MFNRAASTGVVRRLRWSLTGLAVLPAALGFAVLMAQYVRHEQQRLYEQYGERAAVVQVQVQHLLQMGDQELDLPGRYEGVPQERMLLDMMHHEEMFESIAYLDRETRELAFVSRREVAGQRDWAKHPLVGRVLETGQKQYGEIVIDPTSGEPVLPVAQPLMNFNKGAVYAVLAAELRLKKLREFLWESQAAHHGDDVFVLDNRQQIIAHTNPSLVLAAQTYRVGAPVALAHDVEGRWAVAAYSRLTLPGNELVVVVTRPLVEAFSLLFYQLGAGAMVVLFALGLAWWLQRRVATWLVQPIRGLTEVAQNITGGDLGIRAPEHAGDEIGVLGRALNVMVDRLASEQDRLAERVAERTRDLAQAKEKAQEANRMLRLVLDTMPVRIFWKDSNLVYLGCNQLFADDAGRRHPREVVGRTDYEMDWRAMAEQYRADDARVIRSGVAQIGYEEPQKMVDGRMAWLRTSKAPMHDKSGEVIGVLGMYEDVTQHKRIEDELRAAKEAAEAGSRAKSLFLASMSHELRTPLNAILGYAQLMEITPDMPPELQSNAKEIRHAGELLLSLVNDILDLARVETGSMEVLMQTVSLSAVLAECLAQSEGMASNRRITIGMDRSCGDSFVEADPRRLQQVLNNLLSNAIKYNHSNGRVDVSCAILATGRVRIEVRDTGVGLTPQQRAQLFQPFNRLGAEMGTTQGTGIGLVLCRRLVEAMQGSIGVESEKGRGSVFWLELQQAQVDQPWRGPRTGLHILVAEDYGPNQLILGRQLQTLGHSAEIRADGVAALQAWREGAYDLVLTDLNMPHMDGVELTRQIRQAESDRGASSRVPVIGVTAVSEAQEVRRCLEAGMDEVLHKPIELRRLRELLQKYGGSKTDVRQDEAPAEGGGTERAEEARMEQLPAPGVDRSVLDVAQLYEVMGSTDPDQARDLIDTFMQAASKGLARLDAHTDAATLAREMHKQKSSARTVGARQYAELAEALEQQSKTGETGAPKEWLGKLTQALERVREQIWHMSQDGLLPTTQPSDLAPAPQQVGCKSVLLVDDDPVVLKQLTTLLQTHGVEQVLTASNGVDALEVAARYGETLEVLVSDLSMPSMDGVELVRRFGQTGFKGGVVLMSGAELPILRTVHELAVMQGLRVLGELRKPVLPQDLIRALQARDMPSAPMRRASSAPEISKQAMREAMQRNEFEVWFQPKVDAQSLRPLGMEALARWRRADGSFVPPDLFITLAERDGLIAALSQQLLQQALRAAVQIRDAGHELKLAFNLSSNWLDDLNLPDVIMEMVREAGLQPRDLVLEVTETGVMDDLTTALDVLTRLRLKGFGLSIDDFGIGYSSFEQIGRIPFTEMKLDRSFVNKGSRDVAARAILESSMGMAQKLGLITVAEGVETDADLELVRLLGCDSVQGYLVAKPMPVDDLMVWLSAAGQP